MGFTLDELYEIKSALEFGKYVDSYLGECDESIKLIIREIKLKELEKQIPHINDDSDKESK